MAGKFAGEVTEEHHTTYVANLKYCAQELLQHNIIGLIEPINKYALPGYYLNNYDKGKPSRFYNGRHEICFLKFDYKFILSWKICCLSSILELEFRDIGLVLFQ